jgi:hypothetical protein
VSNLAGEVFAYPVVVFYDGNFNCHKSVCMMAGSGSDSKAHEYVYWGKIRRSKPEIRSQSEGRMTKSERPGHPSPLALSPSDGERVGVRGAWRIVTAEDNAD